MLKDFILSEIEESQKNIAKEITYLKITEDEYTEKIEQKIIYLNDSWATLESLKLSIYTYDEQKDLEERNKPLVDYFNTRSREYRHSIKAPCCEGNSERHRVRYEIELENYEKDSTEFYAEKSMLNSIISNLTKLNYLPLPEN